MATIRARTLGLWATAVAFTLLALAAPALAQTVGQPHQWGTTLQPAATPIMEQITWFEGYTLAIITVITLFVLALIIIVAVRYRASKNPTPSRTTHNTMIEVVWTIVPVLILVAIAFPSFRLLYQQTNIPDPGLTVKAIGGQWYWQYEYMDDAYADIGTLTSYMLDEEQRAERKSQYNMTDGDVPRLLAVDYPLVVPVDTVVHVLTTSLDVNHAVAVPGFGIKADAIKGRINQTWFRAEQTGVFYGQCSELCGRAHAFMPLEVHVVSQEQFEQWATLAKEDIDKATAQLLTWQAGGTEVPVAALAQ